MLRNYAKIAVRNLLRRRFYALVTLVGLTVGITFTLWIGSYIGSESRVNQSLRNADRQCLVQSRWKASGMGLEITTLAPIGPTLKAQYPNLVANFYRYHGITANVSTGEKHFREAIEVGDSTLLPMFGFFMRHGDPRTALNRPNAMVMTAGKALKFFGTTEALGRTLTMQTPLAGKQVFTVTGVLEDPPMNSVTQLLPEPDYVFIPMQNVDYFADRAGILSWQSAYIVTYLELQPGVSPGQLKDPINRMLATYAPPGIKDKVEIYLNPLPDYYRNANNGLVGKMMLTLTVVAFFILLMAVVNFVNITIGTSASRLREIGVRKVLGGLKKQLMAQFLTEALLLTAVAALFALGFYELFRPFVTDVLGTPVPSLIDWPAQAFLLLLGLVLLIGLLAGGYPAFVLAALPSVDSLKGKLRSVGKGIGLRRTLITFQFTVAVFVFVAAVVISRQVSYFFNKELGYHKDQIMTLASVPRDWSAEGVQRMEQVRDRLSRLPGVNRVSLSYEIPNGNNGGRNLLFEEGRDSTEAKTVEFLASDEQFAETYGLTLRAGRFFNAGQGSYTPGQVVLNESAVRQLGWKNPAEAVGHRVKSPGGSPFTICGVVNDFHFASLHQTIQPMAFLHIRDNTIFRYLSFKIQPDRIPKTVTAIEREWAVAFPDAPFEYVFMDDTLQKLYQSEMRLKKAARLTTILSLVIVLLGVLGLVSLNVTRRTKEIGIRKVLGASVPGIVGLFMKEFALVMIVANLVAWPLAYRLLTDWLARYAYRTEPGWSPFVGVGTLLALLTGLVVCLLVIRAAMTNPVKSLRSE